MLSKKRLLYLTFVVILSVCTLAIAVRVLLRTEVDSRFANLFERPETPPEGLLSVQPEPGSSTPCMAWRLDDPTPAVCSLMVCWEVDDLLGSKGRALGYNFVALLNGKSLDSLDLNQTAYVAAKSEGTGNPNGPDNIESSSYEACRSIHLTPGDYRVTLLTAGDSSQIIYEWAFRITHE